MNPKAFIQTMIALASASLGLVAALAWNDAIKSLLGAIGLGDSLGAKFLYAAIATVIAILVLSALARIAARVGGDAVIQREAEG